MLANRHQYRGNWFNLDSCHVWLPSLIRIRHGQEAPRSTCTKFSKFSVCFLFLHVSWTGSVRNNLLRCNESHQTEEMLSGELTRYYAFNYHLKPADTTPSYIQLDLINSLRLTRRCCSNSCRHSGEWVRRKWISTPQRHIHHLQWLSTMSCRHRAIRASHITRRRTRRRYVPDFQIVHKFSDPVFSPRENKRNSIFSDGTRTRFSD